MSHSQRKKYFFKTGNLDRIEKEQILDSNFNFQRQLSCIVTFDNLQKWLKYRSFFQTFFMNFAKNFCHFLLIFQSECKMKTNFVILWKRNFKSFFSNFLSKKIHFLSHFLSKKITFFSNFLSKKVAKTGQKYPPGFHNV